MTFQLFFTKEAFKDIKKLSSALKNKLQEILLHQIAVDPYSGKKLIGDLSGHGFSRPKLI